ncbi:MAG: tRNA preQ1(34) S-adenosylmethionine ribosyltransferase-isomerase QueA [Deltaproteobacteria bacterium]|nr:tRNA preQ1(34) S-adenosylmethionine ribosyltransferase-isomerase QueA [Deltaproteobacteria bacterium]
MKLWELDYQLRPELVAQEPAAERDQARLLVLERQTGSLHHSRFYRLAQWLSPGDLVVLNDTQVLPARLRARKETGRAVELLLVRPVEPGARRWLALARGSRALGKGARLRLDGDGAVLTVAGADAGGHLIVDSEEPGTPVEELMRRFGMPALPPYIRRPPERRDYAAYQTVYARRPGSVAAPTAGIHVTEATLAGLAQAGIATAFLALHIGPGTFRPIRSEPVEGHSMEAERYEISPETAGAIEHARRLGGRIVAVGTSTVRALESFAVTGRRIDASSLFITPGFRFRLVDCLVTNFHMPRSTVLALVMAFAGRQQVLAAYGEAMRRRYRLLSYGDAMLLL